MYIYPENLSAKAMLFLWTLKDVTVLGIGLLISVFALAKLGFLPPLVITATYGFLTIRLSDTSIMDYIRYAAAYLFVKPQFYEWRQTL